MGKAPPRAKKGSEISGVIPESRRTQQESGSWLPRYVRNSFIPAG